MNILVYDPASWNLSRLYIESAIARYGIRGWTVIFFLPLFCCPVIYYFLSSRFSTRSVLLCVQRQTILLLCFYCAPFHSVSLIWYLLYRKAYCPVLFIFLVSCNNTNPFTLICKFLPLERSFSYQVVIVLFIGVADRVFWLSPSKLQLATSFNSP
ncbi:hypothetical protein BDQ17DRAFT_1355373 [Cyathus striatus]|nr:hypothetical protein BDQ17DRAFT_1355373 [Cyathus striatus]